MSNVIQFLEMMGSGPARSRDYESDIALLDIDNAQREALLNRDDIALNALVAGRSKLYCLIATPDL